MFKDFLIKTIIKLIYSLKSNWISTRTIFQHNRARTHIRQSIHMHIHVHCTCSQYNSVEGMSTKERTVVVVGVTKAKAKMRATASAIARQLSQTMFGTCGRIQNIPNLYKDLCRKYISIHVILNKQTILGIHKWRRKEVQLMPNFGN